MHGQGHTAPSASNTMHSSMSCIQAVLQLCLSVETTSATFISALLMAYSMVSDCISAFWAVDRAPHVLAAYVSLCVRLLVTAFAHQLCDISCLLVSLKQCACQPSFFHQHTSSLVPCLPLVRSLYQVILSCFVPLKRLVHAKHATANVFPLCTSLPNN